MIQVLISFMVTVTSLMVFGVIVYLWKETFKTFDDTPALSVFASMVLDILGAAFLICFVRGAKIFYVALRGLL